MNIKYWTQCRLLDLTHQIRRGPFGGAIKKEIFVEDGFKVYEQGNAIYNDFERGTYFINDWKYRELSGFAVQPDDLIVSCSGTIGRIAIVPKQAKPGIINQALMLIRPNIERITPIFFRHLLESDELQRKLFGLSNGSTMKNVKPLEEIKAAAVRIPPLPEQHRIAAILDKADAVRRKREEGIRLTEDLLRSAFLEMFGDPASNPKKWDRVSLSSLLAIPANYGSMIKPDGGSDGWLDLRVANIQNGKLDLTNEKYIQLPSDMRDRHEVVDGDLLMARAIGSLEHLGKCVVAQPGSRRWAFDSHLMRLRFDQRKVHPEFVRQFLTSPGGRHEFLKHARRSAVQFNINTKELARIQIPLPPLVAQDEFLGLAAKVEAMSVRRWEASSEAERGFSSVVQRAFRGQL